MSVVMTAPNYDDPDPYRDLIRRILEARTGYQNLCGLPPTVIHVDGPMMAALEKKGFSEGAEIAGMKILGRLGSLADTAICSRDAYLFKPPAKKGRK